MLFKARIAVLMMTIVVIGVITALVYGHPADASPPDILTINEEAVAVDQVLDTGIPDGDECIMNYDAVEIAVNLSLDEPNAGVALRLDDDCRLLVVSKYRNVGTAKDVPGASGGKIGAFSSSYPRYAVWTRASYQDFAGIDLAVTRVRYNYEERPDEFLFTHGPYEYCHTVSWWKEEECRMDSQSEGSSSITATAYGRFSWHVTGSFRHKQKATFTAKSSGKGTARCWTNTKVSGLTFVCDGDIMPSN